MHSMKSMYQRKVLWLIFEAFLSVWLPIWLLLGYKLAFNYMKAQRYVDAVEVCYKVSSTCPSCWAACFHGWAWGERGMNAPCVWCTAVEEFQDLFWHTGLLDTPCSFFYECHCKEHMIKSMQLGGGFRHSKFEVLVIRCSNLRLGYSLGFWLPSLGESPIKHHMPSASCNSIKNRFAPAAPIILNWRMYRQHFAPASKLVAYSKITT